MSEIVQQGSQSPRGGRLFEDWGMELQNENEKQKQNESAAADAVVYFLNSCPHKPRDRRYHDATKEGYWNGQGLSAPDSSEEPASAAAERTRSE